MTELLTKIQQAETRITQSFSYCETKPFGIIYANEQNPLSYDSNHALIDDYTHLDETIDSIVAYYTHKKIGPRIRHNWQEKEESILLPCLKQHGFTIEQNNNMKLFVHRQASQIEVNPHIQVTRVTQLDDELREIIFGLDKGTWNIKKLEHQLLSPQLHYMVGTEKNGEKVAVATVFIDKAIARIDDVITHPHHRGRGYCSALIHFILAYHKKIASHDIFLYAENEIAIKIYKKAGFRELALPYPVWDAFLKAE